MYDIKLAFSADFPDLIVYTNTQSDARLVYKV
jgi:hypothetical protein